MHGDVPLIIGSPGDGECFGELNMFDVQESGGVMNKDDKIMRRFATCVAVEETHCLIISHQDALSIL